MTRTTAPEREDQQQPLTQGLLSRVVPGWGRRGAVGRVELYTVGSLYVLQWFISLAYGVNATNQAGSTAYGLGILTGVVVLSACGTAVLRATVRWRFEGGPSPWPLVAALVGVAVVAQAALLLLPQDARLSASLIVVGTLCWCAGGLRDPRWQTGLVVVAAASPVLATGDLVAALPGLLIAVFFVFTVQSSLWLLGVVTELDQARGTQAALAVAEERLRFSQDVHDVLGRRLSTIAVQAELAAALADRGDGRAAGQILQVRETAHEGLREARELARGYRPLDLANELDGAVSLLRSAGIETTASLDGLPAAWHEPAARVVREAVTNVLRHSSASLVTITYDAPRMQVRNDGVVARPVGVPSGDGSGLATLRAMLDTVGADLEADQVDDRFELVVTFGRRTEPVPVVATDVRPDGEARR